MSHSNPSVALAALQREFFAASTHPVSVEAGLAELRSGAVSQLGSVERLVRPGPRMSASDCVNVYRESYASRLVECLADDYPAVQFHLGETAFEELARDYVVVHPSGSPSLNYFGRSFSAFCRVRGRDFVAELAELEWALVEAIHASGGGALSLVRLAAVPPEQWAGARFTPNPSLQLLEFTHPVNAFYQAYRTNLAPVAPPKEPSRVAVYRHGTTVWRADLCAGRYALLDALSSGVALGEALDVAASGAQVSSEDVLAWFAKWVEDGFFSDIDW